MDTTKLEESLNDDVVMLIKLIDSYSNFSFKQQSPIIKLLNELNIISEDFLTQGLNYYSNQEKLSFIHNSISFLLCAKTEQPEVDNLKKIKVLSNNEINFLNNLIAGYAK
jgi:hypothetical protein